MQIKQINLSTLVTTITLMLTGVSPAIRATAGEGSPCSQTASQACEAPVPAAIRSTAPSPGPGSVPETEAPAPSLVSPSQPSMANLQLASSFGGSRGVSGMTPNMIGDSTFGGCGGIFSQGALLATIGHPTYACSRLNIAENNSPFVRNRAYLTYRHFHNASPIDIFSNSPQGLARDANLDRLTIGLEKSFADAISLELRLPINWQFGSKAVFMQGNTAPGAAFDRSQNNLDEVLNDRDGEIGNLAMILKGRLYQDRCFYASGGMGINIPTAPDVRLRGNVNDNNFPIFDAQGNLLRQRAVNVAFDGTYRNQTVNLQPFLAGVYTPNARTFLQGFLQVDVPVNESAGGLVITGDVTDNAVGKLGQQTLLRMNIGGGRWLYYAPDDCYLTGIGVMLEFHYTTTLNDADVAVLSQQTLRSGDTFQPAFGNLNNRVDSANMVLGIPIRIGATTIYNGFVTPLRDAPDRGFDFEYSLTLNRDF